MSDIVLPAGRKMALLKRALSLVSCFDFRILFALFEEADRATGVTEISHERLARLVGCKKRAAERSTARLAAKGIIRIQRKPVGGAEGRQIYGGRGGKNVYHLIVETPSWETIKEGRTAGHGRSSSQTKKTVHRNASTLFPNSSRKNLPYGGAADVGEHPRWRIVKERLKACLGSGVMESWFRQVRVRVEQGTVTMTFPRRFFCNYVTENYGDRLTNVWKAEYPEFSSIRLTWGELDSQISTHSQDDHPLLPGIEKL